MMEEERKEEEVLEERKKRILDLLRKRKDYLVYLVLAFLVWLGYYIRTRNVGLLVDVTTGKYIPVDPDAIGFLRYATYLFENGHFMAVDTLRYYPLNFTWLEEFKLLSYFVVYLYKVLHVFSSAVTLEFADVIYPAVAFSIALIFFFLLVRELFDYKIALLSSLFLIVVPAFLFRTMSGVSDKEALGVVFMFAAFYFYVASWKTKTLIKGVILGILAGISTAAMGLAWGGVFFVFLIIGLFALVEIFFDKFTKKDLIVYAVWLISAEILLGIYFPRKFNLAVYLTSLDAGIPNISLFIGMVKAFLIDKYPKIKKLILRTENIPNGVVAFIITFVLGLIIMSFSVGTRFIINKVPELYITLTEPFGVTRWALTVAEGRQPYFVDWLSQFDGWWYILGFIIGSVILFNHISKRLSKKESWKLTIIYALFIIAFIFSRYGPSSKLNGENSLSIFLYIGSLILFVLFLVYYYFFLFYKRKDELNNIANIDKRYVFLLIWFVIMVIAARSAMRLIFIFAPITTILFAYFSFSLFDWSKKFKDKMLNVGVKVAVIIFVIFIFVGFWQSTIAQARGLGSGTYNTQWQYAGKWIRENTPEDAVFAHWWDYGYLVQYGGQRATLSDGGNTRGAINHFIGRHVLTAENETEALELLKANGATHLLIVSDEIGKYPAFSSIGADKNYDRYSWISTFGLDLQNSQETRNESIYLYRGGTSLDEDFFYQGNLFPQGSAGIGGFLVPIKNIGVENNDSRSYIISQPIAVLVYNGQQYNIPMQCIFVDGKEITFGADGLDGCLRIIPTISANNEVNPIGAAFYLSRRVKNTLFTHLYLFGEESDNFKLVYSDESNMPLALYQGMIIGPLKIWEVSYPEGLIIPEEYYGTKLPDPSVEEVR